MAETKGGRRKRRTGKDLRRKREDKKEKKPRKMEVWKIAEE